MASNQTMAMDNSNNLEALDDKTHNLQESAKDFNKDAAYLETWMRARRLRMQIMIGTSVVGGTGVAVLPVMAYFLI